MNKIIGALTAIGLAAVVFVGMDSFAAEEWKLQLNNIDAGTGSGTIDQNSQYKIICAQPGCYKVGQTGVTMTDLDCTKDYPVGPGNGGNAVAVFASGANTQVATRGFTDAGVVVRQSCNVYKVTP